MRDCIERAVSDGRLSRDKAEEVLDIYDDYVDELQATMSAEAAQVEAGKRTAEAWSFEKAEKKRRELLKIKVWQRIDADLNSYRNAKGEYDPAAAMLAHLDRDQRAPFSNLDGRRKAVLGQLHSSMDEFLATFRRDLKGDVRNKPMLNDVVREAFGEDSGNAMAKELAEAWGHTAEKARKRFNAGGGSIPKRQTTWGMPQTHDSLAVAKAGYDEWRADIIDRLDLSKMVSERTGQPFTKDQIEKVLPSVFETIRTDGLSKLKPSGVAGGRSLANRHLDHRFLVFKSADDWLEYNEKFGGNDPFSVMMGHLDVMARDIAALEILGPNPKATLNYMGQVAKKHAAVSGEQEGFLKSTNGKIKLANDMFGLYSGSTNAPINGKIANSFAGLRSSLQSIQLGAAAISAVTDVNFGRMARQMNGLPQAKVIPSYLKLLNPIDLSDQKLAVRSGLIAENWSQIAAAQQRYFGDVSGPEISRRLADIVMRVSGLSPWTQAGRWGFGMEFMGAMADYSGNAFDGLPDAMQSTFSRYGLDAASWDKMRAGKLYEYKGATLLRPDDIEDEAIALRVLEMIQGETEYAVPSTSLRGRAALIADTRPGTLQGEMIRSFAMYKNFSVTLFHTHIARMMAQKGAMGKGRYAANLFISTTLMGGLAMQLKEMSKGRDPRPMGSSEFWGAAMLQGGGLGIFGDFLGASTTSRFGGGLAETLAGPVASFINDTSQLTAGNVLQLARGEDPKFGADLSRYIKRYTPGGSLWYGRLAFERLIFDEMQTAMDPDAMEKMRRTETRYRNEYGQRYWWRPGQSAPDRGPDLEKLLEGQE